MFLEQFKSSMVIILLIAAIVSGVIGVAEGEGLMETFVILGILVINAVIGTVQEKKAQASLEALNKMSSPQTKVLREGQVFQVDSTEIVPGDIVILDTGDIVPADIRLIEAVNLKIQESALDRGIRPGGKNRHHPGRNGYSFGRQGQYGLFHGSGNLRTRQRNRNRDRHADASG